jgi:hypothetical protein
MDRPRAGSPGRSDELSEIARRWTDASCAAQGIEVKITDPGVLAAVATLLSASRPATDR